MGPRTSEGAAGMGATGAKMGVTPNGGISTGELNICKNSVDSLSKVI